MITYQYFVIHFITPRFHANEGLVKYFNIFPQNITDAVCKEENNNESFSKK